MVMIKDNIMIEAVVDCIRKTYDEIIINPDTPCNIHKWDYIIDSNLGLSIPYYRRELLVYSLEVQSRITTKAPNHELDSWSLGIIRIAFGEILNNQIGEYNPRNSHTIYFNAPLPPGRGTYHVNIKGQWFSEKITEYIKNLNTINGIFLIFDHDENGDYCTIIT